jgi:hypothetical protein
MSQPTPILTLDIDGTFAWDNGHPYASYRAALLDKLDECCEEFRDPLGNTISLRCELNNEGIDIQKEPKEPRSYPTRYERKAVI